MANRLPLFLRRNAACFCGAMQLRVSLGGSISLLKAPSAAAPAARVDYLVA